MARGRPGSPAPRVPSQRASTFATGEYLRNGTARILTPFHPRSGRVRVEGATSSTNAALHGWLQRELAAGLAELPPPTPQQEQAGRAAWEAWQQGLTLPITLLSEPPPLRMLLVLDNRAGHRSAALVLWLFRHGVMPLYTPVGGSWLNRAESIRRVLKRRALCGQQPTEPQQIIAWFGAAAAHSNRDPTSFAWGGKRAARRQRQRERHRVGGLGAVTRRPINRRAKPAYPDAQHK